MFEDNNHDRAKLKQIAADYKPPTAGTTNNNNKDVSKAKTATKAKPQLSKSENNTI